MERPRLSWEGPIGVQRGAARLLTGGEGAGAERARVAVRARPTVTPVSAWTAATPHNCSIFCGFLQDLSATGQGFFLKRFRNNEAVI